MQDARYATARALALVFSQYHTDREVWRSRVASTIQNQEDKLAKIEGQIEEECECIFNLRQALPGLEDESLAGFYGNSKQKDTNRLQGLQQRAESVRSVWHELLSLYQAIKAGTLDWEIEDCLRKLFPERKA